MTSSPKILIVAGGRSKRMGRDKSQIEIQPGIRQIDALVALARGVSEELYISSNEPEKMPAGIPVLTDFHPGGGPLAALEAFHAKFPDEPVLLLGCDLFLLDKVTVEHLIARRDPTCGATAYANRIDGRAEPLCAIYEPIAVATAAAAIANEKFCARHFLEDLKPRLLELPHPTALDGANTPEELAEIIAKREHGVTAKPVKILYFAKLREERGLDEESLHTLACTTGGLYEELRFKHRLSLPIGSLRCATNGAFCAWDTLLQSNDEIIFIPPVAGG